MIRFASRLSRGPEVRASRPPTAGPVTLAVRSLRVMLPVVLLLAVGSAACGSNPDRSPGAPVDEPPWGLDRIDLPDDAASVEAVLAAMPERVAGLGRLEGGPNEADYEGDADIHVIQLTGPTENMRATNVLEALRLLSQAGEVGEIEVEQEQLDEDARLVYVIANATAGSEYQGSVRNVRRVYVVSWGAPDSEFLFGAKANSSEARKALVQAFVEASSQA